MKKLKLFPVMMAVALMLTAPAAFAEGSRNLVGHDVEKNGSYAFDYYDDSHYTAGLTEEEKQKRGYYRPFLSYKDSKNADMTMQSVIYVYAQQGEEVHFGTSVVYDDKYTGMEYNLPGTNRPWVITNNLNSVTAWPKWDEINWRESKNSDKFATIAVSICGTNYSDKPKTDSLENFKSGSEINNAASDNNRNNNVYLFTADSGEATQFKDTYTNKEQGYITTQLGGTKVTDKIAEFVGKGYTEPVNESDHYTSGVTEGYIADPMQELAGPNGVIPFNGTGQTTNGYNSLSFIAPITGTYAFRFLPNDKGRTGNMSMSKLSEEKLGHYNAIFSYDRFASEIGMWDITVADAQTHKAKSGRVWTEVLHLNMGADLSVDYSDGELGSNVYVLTRDGFAYQVNFNGMNPWGFSFFSNSRGFLLKTQAEGQEIKTQSLNHSYYSRKDGVDGVGDAPSKTDEDPAGNKWTMSIDPNTIPKTNKDFNHKIFFNPPDEVAARAYTDNNVGVRKDTPVTTDDYTMEYTGAGSNSYNKDDKKTTISVTNQDGTTEEKEVSYHSGTEGIGGNFTINVPKDKMTVTASNTFSIELDFSGYELDDKNVPIRTDDGDWKKRTAEDIQSDEEKSNIVVLSSNNFAEPNDNGDYVCDIFWDGRDAYDNVVPPGIYAQIVTSYWQSGTAHFPLFDVEYNPNGIKMTMLNEISLQGGAGTKDTIYYNNSGVSGSGASAWYFNEFKNGKYSPATDNNITLLGNADEKKNALDGVSTNFYSPATPGATPGPGAIKSTNDKITYEGRKSEAPGDHTAIDIWMRYATTAQQKVMAIGVNPRTEERKPVTPYVSFVGETSEDKLPVPTTKPDSPEQLELGTHVGFFDKVEYDETEEHFESGEWTYTEYPDEHGSASGENYFGNTISTEFVVGITPDVYTYDKVRWTINIPSDSTYVKALPGEENLSLAGITLNLGKAELTDTGVAYSTDQNVSTEENDYNNAERAVGTENGENDEAPEKIDEEGIDGIQLNNSDSDDGIFFEEDKFEDFAAGGEDIPIFGFFEDEAGLNENKRTIGPPKVNAGCIFPVIGFTDDSEYGTLRFRYNLPTQITGSVNVIYGLVIDNLYAPKATASEVRFEPAKVENDNAYFELSEDNTVGSTTDAKGYYENENNEYWKVDPNNTTVSPTSSGQETMNE